jgi:hypothetical protein
MDWLTRSHAWVKPVLVRIVRFQDLNLIRFLAIAAAKQPNKTHVAMMIATVPLGWMRWD